MMIKMEMILLGIFWGCVNPTLSLCVSNFSLFSDTMPLEQGDRLNQPSTSGEKGLSGMLYQDPTHWILWFNDLTIHSDDVSHSFGKGKIEEVQPDKVLCLSPSPKSQKLESITLYPMPSATRIQDATPQ